MVKKYIYSIMLICIYLVSTSICFGLSGIGINPTPTVSTDANAIAVDIISMLQWAGYSIAVGMIIYIGIKYLMASADEKASLKSTVIKFVVGAFLVVNAVTILKMIYG